MKKSIKFLFLCFMFVGLFFAGVSCVPLDESDYKRPEPVETEVNSIQIKENEIYLNGKSKTETEEVLTNLGLGFEAGSDNTADKLYLNGLDITGCELFDESAAATIYSDNNLIIVLEGKNTITTEDNDLEVYSIYANDLTIQGAGSLEVNVLSNAAEGEAYAVRSNGDLTVQSNITVNVSGDCYDSIGLFANGEFTLNSKVNVCTTATGHIFGVTTGGDFTNSGELKVESIDGNSVSGVSCGNFKNIEDATVEVSVDGIFATGLYCAGFDNSGLVQVTANGSQSFYGVNCSDTFDNKGDLLVEATGSNEGCGIIALGIDVLNENDGNIELYVISGEVAMGCYCDNLYNEGSLIIDVEEATIMYGVYIDTEVTNVENFGTLSITMVGGVDTMQSLGIYAFDAVVVNNCDLFINSYGGSNAFQVYCITFENEGYCEFNCIDVSSQALNVYADEAINNGWMECINSNTDPSNESSIMSIYVYDLSNYDQIIIDCSGYSLCEGVVTFDEFENYGQIDVTLQGELCYGFDIICNDGAENVGAMFVYVEESGEVHGIEISGYFENQGDMNVYGDSCDKFYGIRTYIGDDEEVDYFFGNYSSLEVYGYNCKDFVGLYLGSEFENYSSLSVSMDGNSNNAIGIKSTCESANSGNIMIFVFPEEDLIPGEHYITCLQTYNFINFSDIMIDYNASDDEDATIFGLYEQMVLKNYGSISYNSQSTANECLGLVANCGIDNSGSITVMPGSANLVYGIYCGLEYCDTESKIYDLVKDSKPYINNDGQIMVMAMSNVQVLCGVECTGTITNTYGTITINGIEGYNFSGVRAFDLENDSSIYIDVTYENHNLGIVSQGDLINRGQLSVSFRDGNTCVGYLVSNTLHNELNGYISLYASVDAKNLTGLNCAEVINYGNLDISLGNGSNSVIGITCDYLESNEGAYVNITLGNNLDTELSPSASTEFDDCEFTTCGIKAIVAINDGDLSINSNGGLLCCGIEADSFMSGEESYLNIYFGEGNVCVGVRTYDYNNDGQGSIQFAGDTGIMEVCVIHL